jgi:hypothetical protein
LRRVDFCHSLALAVERLPLGTLSRLGAARSDAFASNGVRCAFAPELARHWRFRANPPCPAMLSQIGPSPTLFAVGRTDAFAIG